MTYQIDIDDYIGTWGVSKSYVRNTLSNYKGKPVNVRISSLGGEVSHGLDIRQQFCDHGQVTAYLYGCVASSATIAALGAQRVCMSKYAMFLVHKVSNWVDEWGQYNADQIQVLIDKLQENKLQNDKFDLVLANMYADKCKKKVDDILEVLKAGRWMTAQEALGYGFIDEIIEDPEEGRMNYAGIYNKIDRLGLPALPESARLEPKEGILQTILNKVTSLVDEIGRNHAAPSKNEEFQNQKNMTDRKDFAQVNACLGVESLQFSEQGTLLNEEQVKQIDEAQQKLADENETLRKQNEELNEQVKNLQASDGAKTNQVDPVDNAGEDVMAEAQKLYDAI